MASPNDDALYAMKFTLAGGDAPGAHLAAVRSSPNRVVCSKHVKQLVDAHNLAQPDNEMIVTSLTRCTQDELDEMVAQLRASNPTRVDAADVYPDEKDRNRLIAVPKSSNE